VAQRTFTLNTEPHKAVVGDTLLHFLPEVLGTEMLDAYAILQAAQQAAKDGGDAETLRTSLRAVREFLAALMTDESATLLLTLDVITADNVVAASFTDPAAAKASSASLPGSKVRERLQLPQRILLELLEWVMELHGAGTGASARPTMPSAAS